MKDRHIVRRQKERGQYDLETACEVLDAGLVCHVGFVDGGEPVVIPMLYARDDDRLLLHGSVASRLMRRLSEGLPVCVTVTHLDGLVLAASVFDHSVNYRSVVIFGRARAIENPRDKAHAFDRMVEFMIPGRTREARPANRKETNATTVLELPIESFSVKRREGPAGQPGAGDPRDVWTGVIPITAVAGPPVTEQDPGRVPGYVEGFRLGDRRPAGEPA
jgi:nitroimidazol reductase NimA-like FMN-containing flavoprotein (pyridoxamine 5'-phosphate oxidase superfamily)